MPAPVPFHIDTEIVGGQIIVDGQDVSHRVVGYELRGSDNAPTVLTLHHLAGAAPIEGEAIVQVISEQADPVEIIVGFLSRIDPEQLQRDCMSGGMGRSPIAKALEVLAGYAAGEL